MLCLLNDKFCNNVIDPIVGWLNFSVATKLISLCATVRATDHVCTYEGVVSHDPDKGSLYTPSVYGIALVRQPLPHSSNCVVTTLDAHSSTDAITECPPL